MRKHLLLIAGIISLFIFNTANAQTDSTHYDLGRISVSKSFTQNITIKAGDIERYQFSNISDAINVFFSGTFTHSSTNSTSVVYVIDGNIVSDVNAYSIQDVEEITLVQSALGQVSGGSSSQQMILIKTRRGGPGKQGIIASNQTGLVNARNNHNYSGANKPAGIYEQAYAGAYKNYTDGDIGISADYLHDTYPQILPNMYTNADPFHFNRLKLNAYADARLWKGTGLSFAANYAPQVTNETYLFNESTANSLLQVTGKSHASQHIFNTNIALSSHIIAGLTNTFSGGYNNYRYNEGGTYYAFFTEPGAGYSNATHTNISAYQEANTWLLKDNLAYHQQLGDWNIDPSVNFMYRHLKDTLNYLQLSYQDSLSSPAQANASYSKATFKLSLLTPSLNIYYKNVFDIQGGFVAILNKENFGPNFPVQHLLPFVSASLNISEMAKLQAIKLSVFGSFARQNAFLIDPYVSLSGFELEGFSNITAPQFNQSELFGVSSFNIYQAYNNYQGGFMFGVTKNFTVDYNFRKNYYGTLAEFIIPVNIAEAQLEEFYEKANAITHRIGFRYIIHSGNLNWVSGLNATESKLQLANSAISPAINQYLDKGHRWTGGFTNRFVYHDYFAGLDILYQVGQRPFSLEHWQPQDRDYMPPSNANSFSLQNLYIGERVKVSHLKYAEIYLNTRNILQNKTSDITDERRFYGFGFKLNL
jgi:hypothetical protein